MRRLITAAVIVAVCWLAGAADTRAATQDGAIIVVDTQVDELVDNGNCSLREALQAANTDTPVDACPAGGAADTVQVPGGVYMLGCGTYDPSALGSLDVLTGTVLLQGDVITPTILDGSHTCRVLHVHPGANATIAALTIRNGQGTESYGESEGAFGGGIHNEGALQVTNTTITLNRGGSIFTNPYTSGELPGGGIYNTSVLTITGSVVSDNAAQGGAGVFNSGTLTVINTTISENRGYDGGWCSGRACESGGSGSGLFNVGVAVLVNSTVSGNTAGDAWCLPRPYGLQDLPGDGGGIYNWGVLALENCTIAHNAPGSCRADGPTVRGRGGGVLNRGSLRLRNTILAANRGGDAAGTLESQGYNLIDSTTGYTLTGYLDGNVIGQSAGLRALDDNGGPALTHALSGWSAAIDAGSCTDSHGQPITQDQRGEPRPMLETCDIGAYEAATIEPYDQAWLPAVGREE